jgi:hypothetical protein
MGQQTVLTNQMSLQPVNFHLAKLAISNAKTDVACHINFAVIILMIVETIRMKRIAVTIK